MFSSNTCNTVTRVKIHFQKKIIHWSKAWILLLSLLASSGLWIFHHALLKFYFSVYSDILSSTMTAHLQHMLSTAEKINFLSIQLKIQYTVTYNELRYWEGSLPSRVMQAVFKSYNLVPELPWEHTLMLHNNTYQRNTLNYQAEVKSLF